MLLYHGSNIPVEKPRLIGQTRGLDFGPGFYLTSSETQATEFSRIIVNRRKTGVPTVSVYEYDEVMAKSELVILDFPKANVEWLYFVRDNRLRNYTGKQHDVIVGPVADDKVFFSIQAFIIGVLNVEAALIALRADLLYDQYCFATEKALSVLKYVKSETLGGRSHA
jgi:hypothetical protein